jgi:tetratricopeptide (TPR) repeat protein
MGPFEITAAVEATRRAAQRAGLDPKNIDKALGEIGAAAVRGGGIFELWSAIDREIGKTSEVPILHRLLKELRSSVQEGSISAEIRRLKRIIEQSPDRGWREWVTTQAQGIVAFRFDFCLRVGEGHDLIPATNKPMAEELYTAVRHMCQKRWVEAYGALTQLAEVEFLPDRDRARLFSILGLINLLWFSRHRRAKKLLDNAERLAPDDGVVIAALGDFWRAQQNLGRAISCYRRAREVAPSVALGFVRKGEYFESQDQLGNAEEWYRKAIAADPGDSEGYANLFKLYGRAELFEQHQDELQPLMELAVAVDPPNRYDLYVDLGSVYEQNKQYEGAGEWYEAAISLDETRPHGYLALGRVRRTEGREDDALSAFARANDAAPECPDGGTWETAGHYAQREEWEKAESWYLRVPPAVAEWAGLVRAQIAKAKFKRGNSAEAKQDLLSALRGDNYNEGAKAVLIEIAVDYYQSGDEDAARRIYEETLAILGDAYRADYHNNLGNLAYRREDYVNAAEAYRKAIAASPEDPASAATWRERSATSRIIEHRKKSSKERTV